MNYNINFPSFNIYIWIIVGKNIMIGSFSELPYYGIVIAIGMMAGLAIACWMAKKDRAEHGHLF